MTTSTSLACLCGCGRFATPGRRGNHSRCWERLKKRIAAGELTLEQAQARGLCRPPKPRRAGWGYTGGLPASQYFGRRTP